MKVLRLWLLVVLAVLLPVRGAMAVGMPCAPAASASHAAMDHPMDDMADHAAHVAVMADPAHADHHGHDDGSPGQDKCTLCAASCAATPLASTFAGMPEPHGSTSAAFPGLSVPAPSFLSDGQERPPRST